jgi:hypothetical protein
MNRIARAFGALIVLLVIAACGGGGGGGGGDATPAAQPATGAKSTLATYTTNGSTPSFVITSSDGSTLEFFTNGGAVALNGVGVRRNSLLDFFVRSAHAQALTGPTFTQVLYTDKKKGSKLRGVFDASERISLLVNENTGEFVSIQYKPNRVDYLLFDAGGAFKEGFAVLVNNGTAQVGSVTGKPTFSGALSLTLSGTTSRSGTLIADETAGLSNVKTISGNLANFLVTNYLSPATKTSSLLDFFIGSAYAQVPLNAATIGGTFLTVCGGLMVASAATASSPMLLALGGIAVIAVGTQFVKKGLNQNNQDIWNNQITPGIRNLFDDMLGRFSSGSSSDEVLSADASMISTTGSISATLASLTSRIGDAARDAVSSIRTNLPSVPALPDATTPLQGLFADQNGGIQTASGSVGTSGTLSSTVGTGSGGYNINGTLNPGSGTFSGTFSGGTVGNGTVTGNVQSFGQCQTQQASGGQGSFVKAYDMGQPNGNVTVSYDMFTIPDAMTVVNNGTTVFSTGGLVSNTGGTTFALQGSSVVFVTLTAPNSGTAWEYTLGCAT